MKFKLATKASWSRLGVIVLVLVLVTAWMVAMPGRSFPGNPPASPAEMALADELRRDVTKLAVEIGPRNITYAPEKLKLTADWLAAEFARCGYAVSRQAFACGGTPVENIVAELRGVRNPEEIVVIGAHYDSVPANNCPAANDNGSGVAAVLALAREASGRPQGKTIRFVAFVNEEPPFWRTELMGRRVTNRFYLCRCRVAGWPQWR